MCTCSLKLSGIDAAGGRQRGHTFREIKAKEVKTKTKQIGAHSIPIK